jgi:hypothetical protein
MGPESIHFWPLPFNHFKLNEMKTFFIPIGLETKRQGLFPSRHETAVLPSEGAEDGASG